MFLVDFLKKSVAADDQVTRLFIEVMVPELFQRYVAMSAKGGAHRDDATLNEQQKRGFEALADQSMCTHLLNGIFPSLRLMYLLEEEGIERFTTLERQVYILSYLMHDIDKIKRRLVETKTRDDIEQSMAFIHEELRLCHAEAFLPDVDDYIEDITFLVVNTQQRWQTHLNTYLWHFRLPEKRIALLRRFCTYSDQIAYLVTEPSVIAAAGELATILTDVSKNRLMFSYHQLRDVRGLFSNVINNSVIALFTDDGKRAGIWPYLFFANGVVYLKRKTLSLSITTEQVVAAVKSKLQQLCGGRIKHDAPGFKFDNKGLAKSPEYYFEFLTVEEYLRLLANSTIDRTGEGTTVNPREKLLQMQRSGEIAPDLLIDFVPDRRIGIMSRFLSVVFAEVLGMLPAAEDARRKQLEAEIIAYLGLEPYWESAKTIPARGGMEYRWFWLGAKYLADHPGISTDEGKGNLRAVFQHVCERIVDQVGERLQEAMQGRQKYLCHLPAYLASTVELPFATEAERRLPDFRAELAGYESAKAKKGRKLICTLCNSAYPTEEQSDNAVLFQPWVYKNKLALYAGKNAGGVCAICALELMLRQLLQKGSLRLTGAKFESLKSKYITIYPNYFFTAETGGMVQEIITRLWNINFFSLRHQLGGKTLSVGDVLRCELFEAPPTAKQAAVRVLQEEEDESEDAELEDEENENGESGAEDARHAIGAKEVVDEQEQAQQLAERSYLKYDYYHYPGMCFFGMRAGKDDNDTASWAMPALLALALPVVTGAKVVISELLLPLFASGHDFHETVVFDAPHPYLGRLLDDSREQQQKSRVRVNRVLRKLSLLVQVYQVNIETYAKGGKPEWKHLLEIVRDLETDPLYVFSYLRKQDRIGAYYASTIEAYLGLYRRVCMELLDTVTRETFFNMKEDDLGNIQQCVDRYVVFYRGGYETHSILKPIDIVAKAIINSPLEIDEDDLLWQIQGELKNWLDRVRSRQATGRAMFWGREVESKEEPALREFISYFYQQVFKVYCQGERGLLRSRLNRFKDGCEAYYVHLRALQRIQEQEAEPATM